ncbi:MAG TPA: F0F1 ATP synthase subunit delta [Rheinheimera sp.]|nr:F0F1 ATP synthase subunit delta [Rheinheimera sp.]
MSELTNVARPYAKAAFDFAVEQKALAAWAEMLFFAAEVVKNEQVSQRLLSNTAADAQAAFFIQVCGEQLNAHGQNFIKVMAENNRLAALPAVYEAYLVLKAEHEKEITVDVVSANELTADYQKKLSAALSQRFAREVKLNCSVDPAVVGGMLIKAGDLVIDGSVRGKLDRLATALQS